MSKGDEDEEYRPNRNFRSTRKEPYVTRLKNEPVDVYTNDIDSAPGAETTSIQFDRQDSLSIIEEELKKTTLSTERWQAKVNLRECSR